MKVLSIVVLSLIVAVSTAEENKDKREKVAAFFKCLACGNTPQALEDFKKCLELRPQKAKDMAETCKQQVMPDITEENERWNHICQYPGTVGKLHDCIMTDENRKLITPEDLIELGKFKECAKEVHVNYCKQE